MIVAANLHLLRARLPSGLALLVTPANEIGRAQLVDAPGELLFAEAEPEPEEEKSNP